MADTSPRLISYDSPSAFLDAVLPFDRWHLNAAIGPSLLLLLDQKPANWQAWLTVWTGDELDVLLTRTNPMVYLSCTRHIESVPPSWLQPRVALLVTAFHRLVSSSVTAPLSSATGPDKLVQAFVAGWTACTGTSADPKPVLDIKLAHVPRDRFKASGPVLPASHSIRRLTPDDAVEDLLEGYLNDGGHMVALPGKAREIVLQGRTYKELWLVYTVEEQLAGFVRTGRVTARCASIRTLFVSPKFRKLGIGETLVRETVKQLMQSPHPLSHELSPLTDSPLEIGDVTLFVEIENVGAMRLYQRLGFGLDEGEWMEEDGRSWEHWLEMGYEGQEKRGWP